MILSMIASATIWSAMASYHALTGICDAMMVDFFPCMSLLYPWVDFLPQYLKIVVRNHREWAVLYILSSWVPSGCSPWLLLLLIVLLALLYLHTAPCALSGMPYIQVLLQCSFSLFLYCPLWKGFYLRSWNQDQPVVVSSYDPTLCLHRNLYAPGSFISKACSLDKPFDSSVASVIPLFGNKPWGKLLIVGHFIKCKILLWSLEGRMHSQQAHMLHPTECFFIHWHYLICLILVRNTLSLLCIVLVYLNILGGVKHGYFLSHISVGYAIIMSQQTYMPITLNR